jgi:hypothetical protein
MELEDLGFASEEQYKESLPHLINYLALYEKRGGGKLFFDVEDLENVCGTKNIRSSMRFVRDVSENKVYLVYIAEEFEPEKGE